MEIKLEAFYKERLHKLESANVPDLVAISEAKQKLADLQEYYRQRELGLTVFPPPPQNNPKKLSTVHRTYFDEQDTVAMLLEWLYTEVPICINKTLSLTGLFTGKQYPISKYLTNKLSIQDDLGMIGIAGETEYCFFSIDGMDLFRLLIIGEDETIDDLAIVEVNNDKNQEEVR